jgi:hypothetical protein
LRSPGRYLDYQYKNVAVVNQDGQVTPVGAGVATITATSNSDGGIYSQAAITVNKKVLTVDASVTAEDKIYDGTTEATVTGAALSGAVTGDDVTLENYTSDTFAQADVGENIAVTTVMTLTGADAGNYD